MESDGKTESTRPTATTLRIGVVVVFQQSAVAGLPAGEIGRHDVDSRTGDIKVSDILHDLNQWREIKHAQALEYAGTPEGKGCMVEAVRYKRAFEEIESIRQQLATDKAEFEQCSTMLDNAERHIEMLEKQLAAVQEELRVTNQIDFPYKVEKVVEGWVVKLVAALAACDVKNVALQEVEGLISESSGVYGLHLNGDESPWEEVEMGGRFERLTTLPEALAIQPDDSELKAHDEVLIERCADAAELEILGDVEREDDEAYNIAVKHCTSAIRELK